MTYYYLIATTKIGRATEIAYTYHHDTALKKGALVRVSLGNKLVNGVIIDFAKKPSFKTKAIHQVLYAETLPVELLDLVKWISQYYNAHFATALQSILPLGVQKQRRISNREISILPKRNRTNIILNNQQSTAVKAIASAKSGTFLLHGVTGSGKTTVYIKAAQKEIAAKKSVLILVPEISLTPQLLSEFSQYFDNLVVTHSKLTESERHKIWQQILQQQNPLVIIGPRSALFMPIRNLGLIVIDECHESSYKQDSTPKYSSQRVASILARLHQAKLVLGSATPLIVDYYLAKQNKAPVLELTKPAAQLQPVATQLVDLKLRKNFTQHRFLSDQMLQAIEKALANKHQVLIFHNRRGTATTTLCEECGWQALCPDCFLPLTLHGDKHKLICHLCGFSKSIIPNCPQCQQPNVLYKGIGTKLIKTEIAKRFPKAKIARFDADTNKKEDMHTKYQELYDGKIDIIIGTQIIAKGLDLPNLTTVGVVQADSGLILPDFTSEEKVFQLLCQVMGRAGRGKLTGNIVIQTFQPEHSIIKLALNRDYHNFYEQELNRRKALDLPPFSHLLKIICSYKTEQGAINASRKFANTILNKYKKVTILGPTPAFHERLGGNFRWQIIIKSKQRSTLVQIANEAPPKWQTDLDPSSLL